ncbi:hypothetical protein L3X38_025301 [Prunus dulcis]|uniref:Uncharacterized protein n=1 Tax=Prunus dulcis TaxID=3755 RepID=A0AAD4Z7V2_PRUDU|nr:hypothetical protein L3X38_025301 [Prunus dulcis]
MFRQFDPSVDYGVWQHVVSELHSSEV